jgi:hypothetical protein
MSVEPTETGAGDAQAAPAKQATCCGGKASLAKKIFLALALIVAVLAAVIAMQPSEFRIERSIAVSAPPAEVFAEVDDLHNWEAWSPWLEADPQAKTEYEGASSGEGAIFKWSGNSNVGEGNMTIVESRPNELVRIKLQFLRPMAGESTGEFTFKPKGEQTEVTWSMFGHNNFMSKAIHMFIDMDAMIGGQFEKGLSKLKAVAEAKAEK